MSETDSLHEEWRQVCKAQRQMAQAFPCYVPLMVFEDRFQWQYTDRWVIKFVLETWCAPARWHGSIVLFEDVPNTENQYGLPQKAHLPPSQWTPEHFQEARALLADVFGPILRPGDNSQKALDYTGPDCLHWVVPCDHLLDIRGVNGRQKSALVTS